VKTISIIKNQNDLVEKK